ncbi:MAG: hypothetical protein OEY00_09025 [Gammaproteobacteria bacterium]|nr:hypothetical protein [Gammaproteobacteria bacterium]
MKSFFVFALFALVAGSGCARNNTDSIEQAFQSFYGEPLKLVTHNKEIKLHVNAIEENAANIPVTMSFNVPVVEKVLLLKQKNTGYPDTGYFNRQCAEEPVFISSYELDASQNITELATRIRTYCNLDTITLMLWAKTRDGKLVGRISVA